MPENSSKSWKFTSIRASFQFSSPFCFARRFSSQLAVIFFCSVFLSFAPHSAGQTITTIAGGGIAGGSAHTSFIDYPQGVVRDSLGNTYIASPDGEYAFKLDTANNLTIIAGLGHAGFAGDGGPATSAPLATPSGMALDHAGNLFIADALNNRIRHVNFTTGKISTVAGSGPANMYFQGSYAGDGGPATQARLNSPYGVAVDTLGNLYIADSLNYSVRRVDATTGVITTVAGNGTNGFSGDGGAAINAQLGELLGVMLDGSNNLYIADSGNNRIRRVDAATQIITTVAGNGMAGFSGDGGAATLAELSFPNAVTLDRSGNLLIADTGNERIRSVNAGTQIISTFAGDGIAGFKGDGGAATLAEIDCPAQIFVDSAGNLLIADGGNQRIRSVSPAGIITTVAGGGSGGDGGSATSALLATPQSVAVDRNGNLFIATASDDRIRRVTRVGIISTAAGNGTEGFSGDGGLATRAQLFSPAGIAVDSSGNIYISDAGNLRVRKVDASTGIITTFAGDGTFCTVAPCGDGGPATSAQIDIPGVVALDSQGDLFIACPDLDTVRRVDATTGIITTIAGDLMACSPSTSQCGDGGLAVNASLNTPFGVAVDATGNVFIADTNDNRIRRVDASTQFISTVAFTGVPGFSGDGGPALSATMTGPLGVAVDSHGNLFISAGYDISILLGGADEVVRRVTASTQIISTYAGRSSAPTLFGFAGDGGRSTNALLNNTVATVDSAGNVYISDAGNNRIRKIAP